jgi:starvation-inducible DNA-binding protein
MARSPASRQSNNIRALARKSKAPPLATTSDLGDQAVAKVAAAVNALVADTFVLYMKTKNFHWHMSGKHFRDYHLLLDEHATDIESAIDPLAERVRKLGADTLHSLKEALELTSLRESEGEYLTPREMFDQLIADNKTVVHNLRKAHEVCDEAEDVATASLIEELIDHSERRLWFLFETNQARENSDS